LFENLVEIGKIPLAFAGVYGAFDEAKLPAGQGVMDVMLRAPGNEFAGRHRPGFERSLRRRVILALPLGFASWRKDRREAASMAFGE